MANPSIEAQLQAQMAQLPPQHQQRVLEFARSLLKPEMNGSESLLRLVGSISANDLAIIERVIEEECERLEPEDRESAA